MNVTVVPSGPLGYLTIWPTGQDQPYVSTLNSFDGRVKANAAIVPAGDLGAVSVFATNPTQVIIDISGYFVDPNAWRTGPNSRKRTELPNPRVRLRNSSTAQAYALNATVVPHGVLGYLTLRPAGQPQPYVSTLNSFTGTVVANAALVKAGASGYLNAYATNNADLILDINGYFAPAVPQNGALSYYPRTPCRIADTRMTPNGVFAGPRLLGGSTRNYPVWMSPCHIPEVARAYITNVTVVPAEPLGFLTLWPFQEARPFVSTLNAFDGAVVSNMAIVRAADPPTLINRRGGSISVYATHTTEVVLDTTGFFAP